MRKHVSTAQRTTSALGLGWLGDLSNQFPISYFMSQLYRPQKDLDEAEFLVALGHSSLKPSLRQELLSKVTRGSSDETLGKWGPQVSHPR